MHPETTEGMRRAVLREYTDSAADYDRRWLHYNEHTLGEALAAAKGLPGKRLVDVGCGTGLLLEGLASTRPEAELLGIDLVPAMLAVARRRIGDAAWLVRADAAMLPLPGASVDVLTSVSMLHCLPDAEQAVAGFRRVLRPGGRLVVIDWCADALRTRLLRRLLPLAGHAPVRPLRSRDLAGILARQGFVGITVARFGAGPLWAMMRLTAVRPDESAGLRRVAPDRRSR